MKNYDLITCLDDINNKFSKDKTQYKNADKAITFQFFFLVSTLLSLGSCYCEDSFDG